MSTTSSQAVTNVDGSPGDEETPPRRSRSRAIAVGSGIAVILVAAGGIGVARAVGAFGTTGHTGNGVTTNHGPTSLTAITQGSLSSQTQVSGTLGYAGEYTVLNHAMGTFTSLPATGQTIRRGRVLYEVSNKPVVLLTGALPPYRSLSQGMLGPDVQQLNRNLVALGYATRSELNPNSRYFGAETVTALEKLQAHLDVSQSGKLSLGQAMFVPTATVRVTKVTAALGSLAGPGSPVLQASSTRRVVTVALDTSEESYVKDGDKVTVTLPDNTTTPGIVTSVGSIATQSSGGGATITVDVKLTRPGAAGKLDQAPVQVSITTGSVKNALIVPVDALLALGNGGYAVEIATSASGRSLVPVHLGLFDDATGTVQVSGPGLKADQRVVVPAL
jgi:peptidoglycan hydrolase-like protein with peptidoglycan-binding domain